MLKAYHKNVFKANYKFHELIENDNFCKLCLCEVATKRNSWTVAYHSASVSIDNHSSLDISLPSLSWVMNSEFGLVFFLPFDDLNVILFLNEFRELQDEGGWLRFFRGDTSKFIFLWEFIKSLSLDDNNLFVSCVQTITTIIKKQNDDHADYNNDKNNNKKKKKHRKSSEFGFNEKIVEAMVVRDFEALESCFPEMTWN